MTRAGGPALRAEQRLRYSLVRELVQGSALWCDLGCGTAVEAAAGLGGANAQRVLLVDRSQEALEEARRQFQGQEVLTRQCDLAHHDGRASVAAEIGEHSGGGPVTITCFDCIEQLESFVPLVSGLVELAERSGHTVVLSVPNDTFWLVDRPERRTSWGEGAFEELRAVLPDDHVVLRQVALQGSAIVRADDRPDIRPVEAALEPEGVPSHLLVAFGPRTAQLGAGLAAVAQVD